MGLEVHNVTMDNSDVYTVTRKSDYGDRTIRHASKKKR